MGLRYLATHQSEAVTRDRAEEGECYVAVAEGKIVGTICFRAPSESGGSPWYDRSDVASLGQFCVDPEFQGRGIGTRLLNLAEERARECGAAEIALDTSEDALHLIELYAANGYRVVEWVKWEEVNYRSVIMSKPVNDAQW
jgi:GNAT superfamily N-acetyltransferase